MLLPLFNGVGLVELSGDLFIQLLTEGLFDELAGISAGLPGKAPPS